MRVLVTGAAGMLGTSLVPALLGAGHQLVATDIDMNRPRPWGSRGPALSSLDVRSFDDIRDAVSTVGPDLVIHLAAETNLEYCESNAEAAYHTNTIGTKHVALACQRSDVPLVYVSTAGVFDGQKQDPYTEFDVPNPINVYGASKYEGEKLVQSFLDRWYVIRAGWMVGGGARDHKFVAKILAQVEEGRKVIHAVADKFGTPTYAPDFSLCLMGLLETDNYGLYHMACEGWARRADVAAAILEALGRDEIELVEVDSEHFREEFFAPRPRSEVMRNLNLELAGLNVMRPWREALQEYLATEFKDLFSTELSIDLRTAPAPYRHVADAKSLAG